MDLKELQRCLGSGQNPYIDVIQYNKVLLHYVEEVGELIKALRKRQPKEEIERELGDNMILLCFVAESLQLDLDECTRRKIAENIEKGKFKPELHKEWFKDITLKEE